METAGLIDWTSEESHVLLNPRMPDEERRRLESMVIELPAHVWLATSGTTGALKLTALSKRAMLASAAAVNRRLDARANDVWYRVLPEFHVGGLAMEARAFLTGARIVGTPWNPRGFADAMDMTLASLVPAQVSDLVNADAKPPRHLRAVIVGGGALSDELDRRGRELGWPLLPSYGMTECGSQIATASFDSPELVLLEHLEARVDGEGCLSFRGESLLTGYATESGFRDPKVDGWFATEDLGAIRGRVLAIEGRRGDFLKIGGESVDLRRLDAILEAIAGRHAAVVAVPDDRLEHVIHLAVDGTLDAASVASAFDGRVLPFERARHVHRVAEIPRSGLGKLRRQALLESLSGDRDGAKE